MYDDCFAKMGIKKCGVLKQMLCQNGKCPFFKTKKQYKAEQEKYPHRDKIADGGNKNGT